MNYSSNNDYFLFAATNSLSIPTCLLAAILVLVLKLFKIAVYRLALYQVLAGLAYAVAELSQVTLIKYQTNADESLRICTAIAWFGMYFIWVKLLFTMWVTFHLFCFAVLHKNMKKLEALYVVTSLLVPSVIAIVPLTTESYGFSRIDGCYIPAYANNVNYTLRLQAAVIERFVLWECPAMVILVATSAAMSVMVIKVTGIVCGRSKYQPITDGDQFWKALKQLLPLAAFPIIFLVFTVPYVIYDIYYSFVTSTPKEVLVVFGNISISLWSMASAVTLIVHIAVAQLPAYCRRKSRTKWAKRASKMTYMLSAASST